MTPKERARLIDKQEFEAEAKAIRERAYALIARHRPTPTAPETRTGKVITHNGTTLTIAEWSKKIGVSIAAIQLRLRQGRPLEEVLSAGRLPRSDRAQKGPGSERHPAQSCLVNDQPDEDNKHSNPTHVDRHANIHPYFHEKSFGLNPLSEGASSAPSAIIAQAYPERPKTARSPAGRPLSPPCFANGGVSSNLQASEGTGAGSTAQEIPEITFSKETENA